MRIYQKRLYRKRTATWLGWLLVLVGTFAVFNDSYGQDVRGKNGQLVRPGDSSAYALTVLGRPRIREVVDTRCEFHRTRDRLECIAVKRWDYIMPSKTVSLFIERGHITSIYSERVVNF